MYYVDRGTLKYVNHKCVEGSVYQCAPVGDRKMCTQLYMRDDFQMVPFEILFDPNAPLFIP